MDPHESEPAYSYDADRDMVHAMRLLEEHVSGDEEDFHQRLAASSRRNQKDNKGPNQNHHYHLSNNTIAGNNNLNSNSAAMRSLSGSGSGSFWRTTTTSNTEQPPFHSVAIPSNTPALTGNYNPSTTATVTMTTTAAVNTATTTGTSFLPSPTGEENSGSNSLLWIMDDDFSNRSYSGSGGHRVWDSDNGLERRSGGNGHKMASSNNNKKHRDQQRRLEARLKRESLENITEPGHVVSLDHQTSITTTSSGASATTLTIGSPHRILEANYPPFSDLRHSSGGSSSGGGGGCGAGTLDRSTSDQSTGSILYGKTPNPGAILGKSTSLIFPTGAVTLSSSSSGAGANGSIAMDPGLDLNNGVNHRAGHASVDASAGGGSVESRDSKLRKVNFLLDQCETVRFPFKKKLILSNLGLTVNDLPLPYLCGTPLGNSLYKLSLAGNQLSSIPDILVVSLPTLKHLDLSQCRLHNLPSKWNLPQLKKLDLSYNLLREFPEESMLEGLPELQDLDIYGNKVTVINVPHNPSLLSKLEVLNLGYNDIAYLPDELDQIKSLRVLKVRNNVLTKIPVRICDMDLRSIDVSANPISVPPLETCERGICSMKRYYQQVRLEDQSKGVEEAQPRVARGKFKKEAKKKGGYSGFIKSLSLSKAPCSSSLPSSSNRKLMSSSAPPAPIIVRQQPHSVGSKLPATLATSPTVNIPPEALVQPALATESSEEAEVFSSIAGTEQMEEPSQEPSQEITVNDTLKVIFVGMAMVGKTSMIKRLIEGKRAIVPTHDERTVGMDIYAWDPKQDVRFDHIDSRIVFEDDELAQTCGDVDVKFSVWDFAGQHVYHATHELFFSNCALYVLVWDMGATNKDTLKRKSSLSDEQGDFKLSYDSESESEDVGGGENSDRAGNIDAYTSEVDSRRADRALERDIDEKVQFWVDCIQSSAPGAAILPVASFADYFESDGGQAEAKRRCQMLKERLLRHEQRRIQGIERRLQEYKDQNRADDPAAHRLRNLLSPSSRPKLIFEDGDDCIVRVSGTQYLGFDLLTEKIINIATGRYRGRWTYPLFFGHVGTRIPRMRLQVREAVRKMRDRFKVVEWGYFLNQLRESFGLTCVEDISDALHFLTCIGELSYFGSVMAMNNRSAYDNPTATSNESEKQEKLFSDDDNQLESGTASKSRQHEAKLDDEDDLDEDTGVLSMDETSITAPGTEEGSLSTVEDFMASGLSQFVFLNPRWLVAAVACILRHDLDREIKDTHRLMQGKHAHLDRAHSFQEASLNCPVITAEDAMMLWQAKKITKKAAERAQEYSNNMTLTPFEFLQLLLIRFGVFVPIDLSIEKALLGGTDYAKLVDSIDESSTACDKPNHSVAEVTVEPANNDELALKARFFFLPSLLGPGEPTEAWSFKNAESWKTTLCHSVLFPDGVPPGLMERLTATVLSSVYAASNRHNGDASSSAATLNENAFASATFEGRLRVREVLCWRTAFFLKLGTVVGGEGHSQKESIVEIFCHLAEHDSHLCVGSDYMVVGTRRIIISGRGQVGNGARKIWKGGYLLVCKCLTRVMERYGGLEYETQAFCPDCLAKKPAREASWWEYTAIRSAVKNLEPTLRCHHHGHVIDIRYVAGPLDSIQKPKPLISTPLEPSAVPVQEMLGAIVLVGLWDGKARKVVRAGSGVVVDRKRGLIVTAGHTLINVWGDSKYPFGENYYGLPQGRVVIGVIPDNAEARSKGKAVFRYFAKIVAKDPSFEHGECHLDAVVLRITTKMEEDVGGNGEGCGDQPEIILLNNEKAFKQENLKVLKVSEKVELEEEVRILGFNQGGEGLLGPGESLNRFLDFAKGYVCKLGLGLEFAPEPSQQQQDKTVAVKISGASATSRDRFKPREEIAVMCKTIGGHSGGPCVNQHGEVIGILSRADPADKDRCYLSPASEWKSLIKLAKKSDNVNIVF